MNTEHRYSLDKRGGKAFVHICPSCEKQKFTRYVDNQTMEYIANNVGICSRKINCGYHKPPKEYYKDNPSRSNMDYIPRDRRATKEIAKRHEDDFDTINYNFVEASMTSLLCDNSFVQWLEGLINDPSEGRNNRAVDDVVQRYRLGGSAKTKGAVIFWQIDINDRIRTGKIMQYNPKTGKRVKNKQRPNAINWVHYCLKKRKLLRDDFKLEQCFFGEHLLATNPEATVAVFESEKSAIVSSILFPDLVCLASGGLDGLNERKCRVLKGRNMIFFPDLGCSSIWKKKVESIAKRVFFANYSINDVLEDNATEEEKQQGLDLCDYIVRELGTNKK